MELTAVLTAAEEGGFVALKLQTGSTSQSEPVEEALSSLQEATALPTGAGRAVVTTFAVREHA